MFLFWVKHVEGQDPSLINIQQKVTQEIWLYASRETM